MGACDKDRGMLEGEAADVRSVPAERGSGGGA